MRKHLLVLFALFFIGVNTNAQGFCGFDQVQKELERKNPELKRQREKLEEQLRTKMQSVSFMQKMSQLSQNSQYTGEIYEIPVVVHVIENRTGTGNTGTPNGKQLTDQQIQTWIDNTNKMYAGNYQSSSDPNRNFLPAGDDVDESAVIPFKLVLAKRDKNCQATTGIIRYNCELPGYAKYGLKREGNKGVSEDDIQNTLAPEWDIKYYYNIYIVTGFDGNFSSTSGLLGYASYPTSLSSYRAVMKASVVTKNDDTTLAHEFGHSLGLKHPFKGANEYGGECTINTGDCTVDNDGVCDTEYCRSAYDMSPVPTNQDINPCTNQNYQGVQYNVMNYTHRPIKFTAGQRTRALAVFMASIRAELLNSLAGTPVENSQVTEPTCQVTGNDNGYYRPVIVVLKKINNTFRFETEDYIDKTEICLDKSLTAEIELQDKDNELKISVSEKNKHIKAWIDYNDNGTFESNEEITIKPATKNFIESWFYWEYTYSFTPPITAVTDKYLRLRIILSDNEPNVTPCGTVDGKIVDYLVKINKKDIGTSVKKVDMIVKIIN